MQVMPILFPAGRSLYTSPTYTNSIRSAISKHQNRYAMRRNTKRLADESRDEYEKKMLSIHIATTSALHKHRKQSKSDQQRKRTRRRFHTPTLALRWLRLLRTILIRCGRSRRAKRRYNWARRCTHHFRSSCCR
jgi:hypothetical protein